VQQASSVLSVWLSFPSRLVRDAVRRNGAIEILPKLKGCADKLVKAGYLTVRHDVSKRADGTERACVLYNTTKSGADYHDKNLEPLLRKKQWPVFGLADPVDRFIWFGFGSPKLISARVPKKLTEMLARQIAKSESAKALKILDIEWTDEHTAELQQILRLSGPERALAYTLAVESGLRSVEVASLTRSSFHLDAKPPVVIVEGTSTKNADEARLPLKETTCVQLWPSIYKISFHRRKHSISQPSGK